MPQVKVTATVLNVRKTASIDGPVVGTLQQGQVVDQLDVSGDGQWLKVQAGALSGWSAKQYLQTVAPPGPLQPLLDLAQASPIAAFNWANRGVAPRGYIKGMALVYGRVYCAWKAGEAGALDMARANTGADGTDALAHYAERFQQAGLRNDADGVDTLRHVFVLLLGLGMRESSGRFCEGRDTSANNTSAETCEAGLFQTSFNARTASPLLPALFERYQGQPAGFREVFEEGVTCTAAGLQNFGSGDGVEFQRLSKDSPAFAAEFAAIGLRHLRTHWGPINQRTAEIRPEADVLFQAVERMVDDKGLCAALAP